LNRTAISWVVGPDGASGFTWNPLIGCSPRSSGCKACYAARLASTRLAHLPQYHGLAHDGKWSGEVRFFPEKLSEPLRRRTPSGIFLNDMGDTFHESVSNEQIAAMYGVMAACPQHLFYVCTKRAKRRREWFEWVGNHCSTEDGTRPPSVCGYFARQAGVSLPGPLHVSAGGVMADVPWPLPNVIELTSVENQATANERIPDALATPAAVRGLSMEPLLESITLRREWIGSFCGCGMQTDACDDWKSGAGCRFAPPRISWIVCGGESGSRARPCQVEWIRSIVRQCLEAGVACWAKQLGANVREREPSNWPNGYPGPGTVRLEGDGFGNYHVRGLRDRAGANPDEWPADLKVRQMPEPHR
jgi:protein gp37